MLLLNFTKLKEVIYINSIDFLEEELLEEKEKIEFLIELCNKYRNENRRYYNLPIPKEIISTHDNKIGYGNYNNINFLEEYKEELKFYKYVAQHYDNNDFIITAGQLNGGIYDAEQIEMFYISPEARRKVHSICDEIEKSIEKIEKLL